MNKVSLVVSRAASYRWFFSFAVCFLAGVVTAVAGASQEITNSNLLSITEFQNTLSNSVQVVRSFRLVGSVRAVVPEQNIVVLQDTSASVMLQVPSVSRKVRVGDWLAVEGDHSLLIQTRYGIQVGDTAVVDNDGLHSAMEKSGRTFLEAGMNPIRLTWFNGIGEFALNLEYEGPGVLRQIVPASVLWHDPAGETHSNQSDYNPGVHYMAFEGNVWEVLPNFAQFSPVAEDVATNFSVTYRTRDENCGLTFDGFIQIGRPGLYSFYLTADDGARLTVGKPSVSCELIAPLGQSIPASESFEQALADRGSDHWIEIEGEVAFAAENLRSLEIEMLVGGNRLPVTVLEGAALFSTNLLHQWIRVGGICKFSRDFDKKLVGIFVPGSEQVKILSSPESVRDYSTSDVLTMAGQVRRLTPEQASKHVAAKIRGVAIYATSKTVVLQDSSGGIFVNSGTADVWQKTPALGELWEIEGTTGPAFFSPVIVANTARFLGNAALPEPIRPTRDQLMNGNLDAEYVELHGVLTAFSDTEITLLTADGKITVLGASDRPLPRLPMPVAGGGSLVGSVVRIRGCFATLVDFQTRQVIAGKIYLYPALVAVEDAPLTDPFLLPDRKASDLMWFDARASALQQTKVAGQIIFALPGEYFMMDGGTGFRVFANDSSVLRTGDQVEVVGFPKLGGPSPVLQEAHLRKTGHTELPDPARVSPANLLNRNRDSTLVQLEALLISDTIHQDERVLELQRGPQHFVARLKSNPRTRTLLPAGCRLQLTGIYASADEDRGGANLAPFELLLNNAAGIVVLQQPPWWTVRRTITVMSVLVGTLGLMFIWVVLLRRKVEGRTAQLKREIEERQLVEQHRAIEHERARVAQDLHDELGAGLTEVSMLGSLANTPAIPLETKERYLDQLTQMARSLVTSLDEIVWAVDPHYDSADSLANYFSLFGQRFLKLAEITCRLQIMDDIPECSLDSKVRHEVFCAFKEALNNVVRHSQATEVHIVFKMACDQLVVSILDNGRGFEPAGAVPGKDGLASLRQRMQKLGGDCQISSKPGSGTKVELYLPLKRTQYGQNCNR